MTRKNIFHITTSDLENLKNSGKLFKFKTGKIKLKFSFSKEYSGTHKLYDIRLSELGHHYYLALIFLYQIYEIGLLVPRRIDWYI